MSAVIEALREFQFEIDQLSFRQRHTLNALLSCRTKTLGAHTQGCSNCGHQKIFYNSCRNRHCPQCRGLGSAIWVDRISSNVLDIPYFHLVFTVPAELQALLYRNQKPLYSIFFKAVQETITELCGDSRYLGAQTGFFSILHTWSQDLHYHPHLHTVVMGGGLSEKNTFRLSKSRFFIPVKVLAKKFRGKFLYYLKKLSAQGSLSCSDFASLLARLYATDWYVYAKENFNGPQAVLRYLGRYTGRVAISDARMIAITKSRVSFTVRDKSDGRKKVLSLAGAEFVRRFLLHVLPKGFVKIRHYGLLANRNRKAKLVLCRRLTSSNFYRPRFAGLSNFEVACLLAGRDLRLCPVCRSGQMKVTGLLEAET